MLESGQEKMWHYFIALAIVVVLAAWGWLKHKAITTFTGALWNRGDKWLWGFFKRKLETVAPTTPPAPAATGKLRTYRGLFQGFQHTRGGVSSRCWMEKRWSKFLW
jgi:hypothetical protein